MKTLNLLLFTALLSVALFFDSCGGGDSKLDSDNQANTETKSDAETDVKREEKKPVSISENDALAEMKKYLKENKPKEMKYARLTGIRNNATDVNNDGLTDYFFTATYNEETWDQEFYFLRDSKENKIIPMKLPPGSKNIHGIKVSKIENGLFHCEYLTYEPVMGSKTFKSSFTIEKDILKIKKKDLKMADKLYRDIELEWEMQLQQDQQENMEAE